MSQPIAVKASYAWEMVSKMAGSFKVPAPFFALLFFLKLDIFQN